MLLEFSCANYKSILKPVSLSLLATNSETLEEKLLISGNKRILPCTVLYGSNSAGKTNILNALNYLKFLINQELLPNEKIPIFPHKSREKEDSEFNIQFIVNKIRYAYGVRLNENNIVEEYLYHFANNRLAIIFERNNVSEYKFGKKYQKQLTDVKNKWHSDNMTFLRVAAIWGKEEEINNVLSFVNDHINVISNRGGALDSDWLQYTFDQLDGSSDNKEIFIDLIKKLGLDIVDIEVNVKRESVRYEDLPFKLPEEIKLSLIKTEKIENNIKLKYPYYITDFSEESNGVQKLFELGGLILKTLSDGGVLVYDEIETSLHPILVENIIKIFMNPDINTRNSQLIFSTHNTNLLDLHLLRKDQIWFVEKCEKLYTDLYSLVEIKGVRKSENIEIGYLRGKYGAVPFKVNDFLDHFTEWNS